MKSPAGLAPHLLAATLFLAAAPLRAADAAASGPLNPQALRARMLEMFDENKDGRLDEAERAKAQTYAEELGFVPAGPLRAQLMQRFDTNGNGRIDDGERAAVREFLRQRMGGGLASMAAAEAPPPEPAVPEKADPAKLELERTIRAALATDPVQLKRFDRDGDGQISHSEWAMARREIQETLGDGLVLTAMATEEEEKKMKAVVDEVTRRRKEPETTRVAPTPEHEQARLDRVAQEVARRREVREKASAALVPPMKSDEQAKREAEFLVRDLLEIGRAQRKEYEGRTLTPEEEKVRLAEVDREVQRRRALRKAAEGDAAQKK